MYKLKRRRFVESLSEPIFRNSQKAYLASFVILAAGLSVAADAGPGLSPAVKAQIDVLVQKQITDGATPGIALAIAKNGQTLYEKADGVRNISSKAPMLVNTPQLSDRSLSSSRRLPSSCSKSRRSSRLMTSCPNTCRNMLMPTKSRSARC